MLVHTHWFLYQNCLMLWLAWSLAIYLTIILHITCTTHHNSCIQSCSRSNHHQGFITIFNAVHSYNQTMKLGNWRTLFWVNIQGWSIILLLCWWISTGVLKASVQIVKSSLAVTTSARTLIILQEIMAHYVPLSEFSWTPGTTSLQNVMLGTLHSQYERGG